MKFNEGLISQLHLRLVRQKLHVNSVTDKNLHEELATLKKPSRVVNR